MPRQRNQSNYYNDRLAATGAGALGGLLGKAFKYQPQLGEVNGELAVTNKPNWFQRNIQGAGSDYQDIQNRLIADAYARKAGIADYKTKQALDEQAKIEAEKRAAIAKQDEQNYLLLKSLGFPVTPENVKEYIAAYAPYIKQYLAQTASNSGEKINLERAQTIADIEKANLARTQASADRSIMEENMPIYRQGRVAQFGMPSLQAQAQQNENALFPTRAQLLEAQLTGTLQDNEIQRTMPRALPQFSIDPATKVWQQIYSETTDDPTTGMRVTKPAQLRPMSKINKSVATPEELNIMFGNANQPTATTNMQPPLLRFKYNSGIYNNE